MPILLEKSQERTYTSRFKVTQYPSGDFSVGNNNNLVRDRQNSKQKSDRDRVSEMPSVMGLSDASNSRNERNHNSRGSSGITPLGKRLTKSAIAILEEHWGHDNCTFGTATLPNLPQKDLETICTNWGKLVNRFMDGLNYLLGSRGLSTNYVYVSEIQEDRWLLYGDFCPHIHWIAQGRLSNREDWRIKPNEVKEIWKRCLENILGFEVDCKAATRIERPRKSLITEMGKYLTKGGKLLKEIKAAGKSEWLPSAYCGMSRALKRLVKSQIIVITDERASWFVANLERLAKSKQLKFRKIMIEYGGEERCVGSVGWFTSDGLQSFMAEYCPRDYSA